MEAVDGSLFVPHIFKAILYISVTSCTYRAVIIMISSSSRCAGVKVDRLPGFLKGWELGRLGEFSRHCLPLSPTSLLHESHRHSPQFTWTFCYMLLLSCSIHYSVALMQEARVQLPSVSYWHKEGNSASASWRSSLRWCYRIQISPLCTRAFDHKFISCAESYYEKFSVSN